MHRVADVDVAEIEITPERIEAAVAEVASYSPEATTTEATAVEVFEAMVRVYKPSLAR